MTKYVAYYRGSTKKQAEVGLGLEAQRAVVAGYVKGVIVSEFSEVKPARKTNANSCSLPSPRPGKKMLF